MLKISVEILPGGNPAQRRTIGVMTVGNSSDLADLSSYEISASESANPVAGTSARSCQTTLEDHDRRQSVWSIVSAAAATVIHENTDWVDW